MKTLSTSLRTVEYGANFFSWGYYFSAGYFCYKKFRDEIAIIVVGEDFVLGYGCSRKVTDRVKSSDLKY